MADITVQRALELAAKRGFDSERLSIIQRQRRYERTSEGGLIFLKQSGCQWFEVKPTEQVVHLSILRNRRSIWL